MRVREVTTQWNTLKEGDKFLRYTRDGSVMMLVVQREAPDVPQEKGVMGYATVELSGVTYGDVFVVRRFEGVVTDLVWVAPLLNGTPGHELADYHIVEFREVETTRKVLPGDLRDAVRDALDTTGTESRGALVDAITGRVRALYVSE